MNNNHILLRHNFVSFPKSSGKIGNEALATVMMNLSHYGYGLSKEAYQTLSQMDPVDFANWWVDNEKELKSLTGDDRKIGDFVVYKNFPAEVLSKSDAEYWIPQLLMYWGFPNEFFTEEVKPREKMNEQPKCVVLRQANSQTLSNILDNHLANKSRWKDWELGEVLFLSSNLPMNLSKIGFKENLVEVASYFIQNNKQVKLNSATDVLRLGAGLSDGDVSLREKVKFKSFNKKTRKYLLSMIENCNNLAEDFARRDEMWKRFLHNLHPGDWKKQFPGVCAAMSALYKDELITFNSLVENYISNQDPKVLEMLSDRPGDYRRRLVHMLDVFGNQAVQSFTDPKVLNKLNNHQIVSLQSFLITANSRKTRMFPPKGNWNKAQLGKKREINKSHMVEIHKALGQVLASRLPKVNLDINTVNIKLPNGNEAGSYARGTVFPIPEEVEFIRTASYWANKSSGNTWFDNGWNFFDENWGDLGSCCWNAVDFGNKAAIFSGDPTNSKEMDGKAAQLIDLYPSQLVKAGVRYAVWNVLCYSNVPFSDAQDVFAALQWGKDAQKGKLFEPSRCQLSFPLTSNQKTKFICLLDLKKREMVYLDANLHGQVSSAARNGNSLAKNMPAFMDYLNSLPSVYDLFANSVDDKSDIHVLYSDKNVELNKGKAYVFKPENKDNKYTPMDLNNFLE